MECKDPTGFNCKDCPNWDECMEIFPNYQEEESYEKMIADALRWKDNERS